jgi:hypothetical protein
MWAERPDEKQRPDQRPATHMRIAPLLAQRPAGEKQHSDAKPRGRLDDIDVAPLV